ncbi:hypothetical protein VCRA217O317_110051 [Vibrio crassostreae]|nr:hypothetical protein VCRA217O317_110051 [Vibrio crassostreae]CAK3216360.1 hypothetical protein VCRA2121O436_180087 [Vibrio crassostreae]
MIYTELFLAWLKVICVKATYIIDGVGELQGGLVSFRGLNLV